MPRLTTLGVTLFTLGCWADFPESRLRATADLTTAADAAIGDGPQKDDLGEGVDGATDSLPTIDQGPDTRPADSRPPLLDASADSPRCDPGAFVVCFGASRLVRCNNRGDGFETTECRPAQCLATLGRCDGCDPSAPASCGGPNERLVCDENGLEQSENCPLGCVSGQCCANVDSDPSSDCDGDCDDNDARVFPTQEEYFTSARLSGDFDYNCDAQQELEIPNLVFCFGSGSNCRGSGWLTTVPACGESGEFASCRRRRGLCVAESEGFQLQGCR